MYLEYSQILLGVSSFTLLSSRFRYTLFPSSNDASNSIALISPIPFIFVSSSIVISFKLDKLYIFNNSKDKSFTFNSFVPDLRIIEISSLSVIFSIPTSFTLSLGLSFIGISFILYFFILSPQIYYSN